MDRATLICAACISPLRPDLWEGMIMQFSKLWYLQHFNLFQEFTREELLTMARVIDLQALERHDQVFQAGEPAGRVYFLKEGYVKIYRRGRFGRKVTLAILKPGEVFGEHARTAGEVHEQSAEVLETATICSMTAREFRALLDLKPTLAFHVIQILGQQKRVLDRKIASLVFKDVPARLAEALLELGEDYGQPCTHGLAL